MKVELSEQDIRNTIEFLGRAPLKGTESLMMVVLMQTFQAALQPNKDGKSEQEIPAKEAPAEESTT